MKQRAYFFSGMGADKRAFSFLKLKDVDPIFIDWIEPLKDERLPDYALRLVKDVEIKPTDILVGLSMGGLIAQEIAAVKPVKKVILISSLRSGEMLRPLFSTAQKLQLLNLVNSDILKTTITSGAKLLFFAQKERLKIMMDMLNQFSGEYYKWAMNEVLQWNGANANCPVYHVHGDKDEIFPVSLVKDAVIVKNGRHLMVTVKAKEVSKILNQFISDSPAG